MKVIVLFLSITNLFASPGNRHFTSQKFTQVFEGPHHKKEIKQIIQSHIKEAIALGGHKEFNSKEPLPGKEKAWELNSPLGRNGLQRVAIIQRTCHELFELKEIHLNLLQKASIKKEKVHLKNLRKLTELFYPYQSKNDELSAFLFSKQYSLRQAAKFLCLSEKWTHL